MEEEREEEEEEEEEEGEMEEEREEEEEEEDRGLKSGMKKVGKDGRRRWCATHILNLLQL